MKDLDFDELDRAVSSLMGGVSKDAPVVTASSTEKILTITPSASSQDAPAPVVAQQPPQTASSQSAPAMPSISSRPAVTQSPLVAKRPNGRFMDMVRSSPTSASPARPLPRQGVTIQPAVSAIVADEPQVQNETTPDSAPAPTRDWPDPIDMARQETAATTSQSEAVEVHHLPDSEPLTADDQVENIAEDEHNPLHTPFLSDSKVEKRPLGAFNEAMPSVLNDSTAATIIAGTSPEDASIDDDADAQLAPDPTDVPVELPAELQDDVMAIESDDVNVNQSEPVATSQMSEKPAAPQQSAEAERPRMPIGVTSIAQQYHTELSTGETEHAGIYDVEAYAQPLQHPVKKKSGWLWVLWIILLLALGSGGAAVLYYLDII